MANNLKETIEERNARFSKMTNQQQRIAIAQDVLDQLEAKKLVAKQGFYIHAQLSSDVDEHTLPENLYNSPQCYVCAKGAFFVSRVLFGGKSFKDTNPNHLFYGEIHDTYTDVFSAAEMNLIEAVFEAGSNYYDEERETNVVFPSDVEDFLGNWDFEATSDEKLKGIAQNVIDNDGQFDLDKLMEKYGS